MTCVPDWIAQRTAERPGAIAAVDARTALCYAELGQRAGHLAALLMARGVTAERIVGICMTPGVELAIAILAVWRAGGAYVAVDPAWPSRRQSEILDLTESALVLVDFATSAAFADTAHPSVLVDARVPLAISGQPASPIEPGSLAYILYTSGSTATPKGVMIEHRHLGAYVAAAIQSYGFPDAGQFLFSSTFAADLGHTPLFCGLSTGGTVHLVPSDMTTDAMALSAYIAAHGIDIVKIVPTHFTALLAGAGTPAALMPRALIIAGGEPLHHEVAETVRRLAPGVGLINEYGPTETTVGVIAGRATTAPRPEAQTVPAGLPLPGSSAFVMNGALEPMPDGESGELFIGGATVGRGYWRDAQLTAERFVPSPFEPGGRLYRSGDGARVLPDGTFEIVGRLDAQVKIRGFRVEPTEIEAVLLRSKRVRGAVVEADRRDDGTAALVAYVAVDADDAADAREQLVRELEAQLPAPMVPGTVIVLRELPLTGNGKVDRDALRRLQRSARDTFEAPQTQIERDLAAIWCTVLKVPRVGRYDSFFFLGGDSILMIKAAALGARHGYEINAKLMFKHPVLFDLAKAVEQVPELR